MKRREFLRRSIVAAAALATIPSIADIIPDDGTQRLPLDLVSFNPGLLETNDAKVIIMYLTGGMSDVVVNMTHMNQIIEEDLSQTKYGESWMTATESGMWQEAGGDILEEIINNGNGTIFKTCYLEREDASHGLNQMRYCHGNDKGYESGIVSTIMHVLNMNNMVDPDVLYTSLTVDGGFYRLLQDFATRDPLPPHLKPVTFNRDFTNPYKYKLDDEGRVSLGDYSANKIFDQAQYSEELDDLINRLPAENVVSDTLKERRNFRDFIETAKLKTLPVEYPTTVDGMRLETAMRLLTESPNTRIVTTIGGHSGWDDHSDAISLHQKRAREMFEAIKAAIDHMEAEGIDNISIVLFGDFGRNLNLNSSYGWDHGNNQAVLWFGGKKYLNHQGLVGETVLDVMIPKARLYNKPAEGSYKFQAYSIAATLYKLFGITNPEVLTGGYKEIDPSSHTGTSFLKNV